MRSQRAVTILYTIPHKFAFHYSVTWIAARVVRLCFILPYIYINNVFSYSIKWPLIVTNNVGS